jgi:retinol dehydrogenase-12
MKTELQRHWPWVIRLFMVCCFLVLKLESRLANGNALQSIVFKPCVYGAYSELYAGFSPDVTTQENGGHLMAWGRKAYLPKDAQNGLKSTAEGGSGAAGQFFEYCDREIKDFL